MTMRKDPIQTALQLLSSLYGLTGTFGQDTRVTVGRMQVSPGSRNTVPGAVRLTLDIRHPDEPTLTQMHAAASLAGG
jgi:N-carbamoyl-L-amino-acid hydrolase